MLRSVVPFHNWDSFEEGKQCVLAISTWFGDNGAWFGCLVAVVVVVVVWWAAAMYWSLERN